MMSGAFTQLNRTIQKRVLQQCTNELGDCQIGIVVQDSGRLEINVADVVLA